MPSGQSVFGRIDAAPCGTTGAFPSPLWGGIRGGGRCERTQRVNNRYPPPLPSPARGEGAHLSSGNVGAPNSPALIPSMAGGHALDLFVELGEHLGAVDAFGGGILDPLVVDRLGLLLGGPDEFRRCLGDLDADLFHALQRG